MRYVGGMVEQATREAADHVFESNERTRIYFGAFFLGGGAFSTEHCDRY